MASEWYFVSKAAGCWQSQVEWWVASEQVRYIALPPHLGSRIEQVRVSESLLSARTSGNRSSQDPCCLPGSPTLHSLYSGWAGGQAGIDLLCMV